MDTYNLYLPADTIFWRNNRYLSFCVHGARDMTIGDTQIQYIVDNVCSSNVSIIQ